MVQNGLAESEMGPTELIAKIKTYLPPDRVALVETA